MIPKTATDKQKAVLRAAARSGSPNAAYLAPTVTPVETDGVLHPTPDNVDTVEIIVDYADMPSNDVLIFSWNGDTSIAPVAADNKPKKVAVPRALVMAATEKTIDVLYSVVDDANPDGVPSEILKLVVDKYLEPVYPAPEITQASGGVLDIAALTADANVTVAAWPGIAAGQKIWLTVTSNPAYGATAWDGEAIVGTGAQATTLDLAKLKTLEDGSTLYLLVEVSLDGTTRVPFPEANFIIKNVAPVYPKPEIKEASGNVLDVVKLSNTASLLVASWPGIAPGQKIWLTVTSDPAYGATSWNDGIVDGFGSQVTFLDAAKLKVLKDGSELLLLVEVSLDGTTRTPFPVATYTIKNVALDYPKPVITEAVADVLDISKLTADANVTVAAWPGIISGEKIWLTVTSDPPYGATFWNGGAIVGNGAQATTLDLARLKTLNDGSELSLLVEVSLDGINRVPFPVKTYSIRTTPQVGKIVTITTVEGADGVEIPSGGSTAYTRVTLTGTVETN
ncbi:hypothetical protein ACIPL1_09660 [Pseudomonas sp. NPDC090202]|uniref:hypothetical protein n=1 Tax=unclassified Pseudomonas TaxID=196821 RepID=UPI003800BFBB